MDVLVIGGSVFLGRAVVAEAQALGADVTAFNRGVSAAAEPDGVTHVRGDRSVPGDVEQLRGRAFDVVVDTCGYVPADVDLSARLLAPSVGRYAFISSINAFPGWPAEPDYHPGGVWDGNPDATRADVPAGFDGSQAYGWLKVGCELAVRRAFGPDRCAAVRAGAIVGPDDSAIGRLPWWLERTARGGAVLAPGAPDDPVALIDARDLARFALSPVAGTFEAGGPVGRDTFGGLLSACAAATGAAGAAAEFSWVDAEWLAGQGVEAWTELPLWIPKSEGPSVWRHDNSAAVAAGLRWRPLAETVADTWAWQQAVPGGWQVSERTPGLHPDRERELLAAWPGASGRS